jgi:hypothetical protein
VGNALDTTSAIPDDTTITVNDTIPPTLVGIVDNKSGGPIAANTLVTYTVTFSEAMDAGTVDASDFGNAGGAAVTIDTVSQISPAVFSVEVTPTSGGTLQLNVNAGAVLADLAANPLDTTSAILDDTTITVDATPPTLTSIVDDKSGGTVLTNALVTYTVTFSEDMDASTVDATVFGNAGTAAVTIGTVTETTSTSGVFTVPVTATGAGTLQLKVNVGAVLNDAVGNALDTTSAILDDTTITVVVPPGNTGSGGTITYTDSNGANPRPTTPWSGGYVVHTFTSSDTYSNSYAVSADLLVVAGGGGGGYNPGNWEGSGGGAGGYLLSTATLSAESYTITVGAGGAVGNPAANGQPSSVVGTGVNVEAVGGGGGSGRAAPTSGGSGGGNANGLGAPGTPGQGNAGGRDIGQEGAGGGGGADAQGQNGVSGSRGGDGGAGKSNSLSGVSTAYAGGGGGGSWNQGTTSSGGVGGGGNGGSGGGLAGTAAVDGTGGGGGGGGSSSAGGKGGSGIVIVRYPYADSGSPYSTWANGANFNDPNSEGIAYGMAWMLGAGTSTSPSVGLLPAVVPGSGLTLHFKRVHDQGAAKLYFQYSSDLATWPDPGLLIPANTYGTDLPLATGITATITEGDPDDVTVTVVPAGHEADGKLFGRLKATEN